MCETHFKNQQSTIDKLEKSSRYAFHAHGLTFTEDFHYYALLSFHIIVSAK